MRVLRLVVAASVLAASALACVSRPEERPGEVVVTATEYPRLARGPGAEHCADLEAVRADMQAENWDAAQDRIDAMIEKLEAYVAAQGGVAVSVANEEEWDQVSAAAGADAKLVPVDWCYRELLHRRAFIYVAQQKFDRALAALDEEARIAPTSPLPYLERGFVMNQLGRSADAKAAYERALALIARFPASAPEKPTALRGLGYALIELGDLDAAEEAFAQSLELEPGNALAISELEYIQKIRAGR